MTDYLGLSVLKELLKRKPGGNLYHRESQTLEFKESFNLAGLPEYCRDFAAFANNRGGYLVFGVTDRPKRRAVGLREKAAEQFDKLDPERLSGELLKVFSAEIVWHHDVFKIGKKTFGAFYVEEARTKTVICKKDEGKDQELRNGDVYYRYGGRTQRIQYAELVNIINDRIEKTNRHWMDLTQKIGRSGPQNAAILDTEKGIIEKGESQILVVGEELVKGIQWIKEGEFSETEGERTLKLIGDVHPIDQIEVVRKEKEDKLKLYPLSARDMVAEVKKRRPSILQHEIYSIIAENDLKNDPKYSSYVFTNRKREEEYERDGSLPKGVTSIYKPTVIDYIIKVFDGER